MHAGQGLLLSASAQARASSTVLDNADVVAQLKGAERSLDQMQQVLQQQQVPGLSAWQSTGLLRELIDPQADGRFEGDVNGQSPFKPHDGRNPGDEPVERFAKPLLLAEALHHIAWTTPASAVAYAGQNLQMTVQHDLHISAGETLATVSGEHVSLFTQSGPLRVQAPPITLQQLREALAFITDQYGELVDGGKNVFVWLWEALQGDFNQNRSTGQLAFDTAVSMVPGVDQICDVRDIIANCKQINDDKDNTWAWVGLVLTLIGLFPTLGSLVKGVLKIFFLFVRRFGLNHITRAVDEAMSWVVTFLRRREVAKYWKHLRWNHVFQELARQVRTVRGLINVNRLLAAFDRAVRLLRNLLGNVTHIPLVGAKAQAIIDLVVGIRAVANRYIGNALRPVQQIMDTIIHRLEVEDLVQRRGVVNSGNVHFSGTLPEDHAITLMRRLEPKPSWLSKGEPTVNQSLKRSEQRAKVDAEAKNDYPHLSDGQIESFAKGMRPDTLVGPMKLYRVVSPSNMGAGADWMSEEVFNTIMRSADPKAAWRKHLAVWPDWNPNGQFVIYELKAGERLKVWRGPAAAQRKDPELFSGHHLEGGYEQIKFDAEIAYRADGSIPRDVGGKPVRSLGDGRQYYEVDQNTGATRPSSMTFEIWKNLPASEQLKYASLRTRINSPRIVGPMDTGWGSTDFGSQLNDARLGLPNLPGQRINR